MTSTRLFLLVMGVVLVVFGAIAPFLRRNYFIGVRVPWTLRDDRVWQRTHRFAAIPAILGGVIALAFGLFSDLAPQWTVVIIAAALMPPIVYAWMLDRRLRSEQQSD